MSEAGLAEDDVAAAQRAAAADRASAAAPDFAPVDKLAQMPAQ